MVTDSTSNIAGNYGQGNTITCILYEGTVTPAATAIDDYGREQKTYTFGAGLAEGDIVALENSTGNTYAATGGLILVEKPTAGETLIIGRIVGTPTPLIKRPTVSTQSDSLSEILAGKYYRMARVELFVPGTIKKFTVSSDSSHATLPGVGTCVKPSIAGCAASHGLVLDSDASGGTGIIPLHAVPAGADGDTCTILAITTGLMTAIA